MFLFAADLVAAAIDCLDPELAAIAKEHFLGGASVFKIQRHRRMKRKEVETCISKAVDEMREYMRRRGIRKAADIM